MEESLEILEYRVFSVVIIDFDMPGLSCKVLLRQTVNAYSKLRFSTNLSDKVTVKSIIEENYELINVRQLLNRQKNALVMFSN